MRFINGLFVLLIFLSALTGCQQEAEIIRIPPPADVITPSDTIAGLLERTTLLDGSSDNIIDHSSCTSVIFPITLLVNGSEITISAKADLKYVEQIFDDSDSDVDTVNIIFPITVVLADHSQHLLQNENDLEDIVRDCEEGGGDDDIECIDFTYPVSFSIYNTNNEVADVITFDSDSALHEFMESLEENVLISVTFPIVMNFNNASITIHNNNELKEAIENAIGECDEDDDNDYDDDDIDDSGLLAALTGSAWKVNYFFDEEDKTSDFSAFTFTFLNDKTVLATKDTIEVNGTWSLYNGSGVLELNMDFDVESNSPFEEIDEEWNVLNYDATSISLKDHEDELDKALTFGKL